jgi:hypothetical protein
MPTPSEVLRTQLAVSIAQKRRLVASWLPPPSADEVTKPEEEEENYELVKRQVITYVLISHVKLSRKMP